jgi:hypothetical protein
MASKLDATSRNRGKGIVPLLMVEDGFGGMTSKSVHDREKRTVPDEA